MQNTNILDFWVLLYVISIYALILNFSKHKTPREYALLGLTIVGSVAGIITFWEFLNPKMLGSIAIYSFYITVATLVIRKLRPQIYESMKKLPMNPICLCHLLCLTVLVGFLQSAKVGIPYAEFASGSLGLFLMTFMAGVFIGVVDIRTTRIKENENWEKRFEPLDWAAAVTLPSLILAFVPFWGMNIGYALFGYDFIFSVSTILLIQWIIQAAYRLPKKWVMPSE